jgi:ribose 5-phosphate isomerase B
MMKIALGGDHAGYEYKNKLVEFLKMKGHEVKDFGPFSADSCDYPDFVHPVAAAVESNEFDKGVLICGSGNGIAITANKHQGVRAALAWKEEIAQLARSHNDANIVCLPARFVTYNEAESIVNVFVETEFEGGRHQNRVDKIACN